MSSVYLKLCSHILCGLLLLGCTGDGKHTALGDYMAKTPSIKGKTSYLASPFVTAGDRVYMVGHQDGSFPELGWHIPGEMGGIWNHPIKLMDGFEILLRQEGELLRFDSTSTFTNYPFSNQHIHRSASPSLQLERRQWVPDGLEGIIIEYSLSNLGDKTLDLELEWIGYSDLRPTWMGEKTGMADGPDNAAFSAEDGLWSVQDSDNPWHVIFGATQSPQSWHERPNNYQGKGVARSLVYPLKLKARKRHHISFIIAGSYAGEAEAKTTFEKIRDQRSELFRKKKRRYDELARRSKLSIPDSLMQKTWLWLKYNSDWLVRTVPEIGTGIGAGLPDYPWWFGVDSEYALKGYMAIGQEQAVLSTISLLDSISQATNGNGRIVHEVSTNGYVFNPGNINETPQFASLVWEVYQWNGNKDFLNRYYPTIKKGLEWLMKENDTNGNLFPEGFGMMEIHGLDSEMIDVASYTQRAFADAAKMALELHDSLNVDKYRDTAEALKKQINEKFWSPEFSSYADFLSTTEEADKLIGEAIIRADTLKKPWAVQELQQTRENLGDANPGEQQPFVVHHNWVVNTPMEMKIADREKALKALNTAEIFTNPFGVFVTGIDRDESAGSDEGSFKGSKSFSYTGAVMTLPTGVLAVAENNYHRQDRALDYLKRMARSFSYALPGSMYEVSPDYGMMTQAWNIYGFAIPIVQQFFGIQPQASLKKIVIRPQMPTEWDSASLENVVVAENEISIFYTRKGKGLSISIAQTRPDWTIELILPQMQDARYKVMRGESVPSEGEGGVRFSTSGFVLEVQRTENRQQ